MANRRGRNNGALGFFVMITLACGAVIVIGVGFLAFSATKGPAPAPTWQPSQSTTSIGDGVADSQAPTAPPVTAPSGGNCDPGADLIVWTKSPSVPPDASALGSYDSAACKAVGRQSTLDMLKQTSPTGPGYCTVAAPASANPGYEDKYVNNSTPNPPRPKGVIFASSSC